MNQQFFNFDCHYHCSRSLLKILNQYSFNLSTRSLLVGIGPKLSAIDKKWWFSTDERTPLQREMSINRCRKFAKESAHSSEELNSPSDRRSQSGNPHRELRRKLEIFFCRSLDLEWEMGATDGRIAVRRIGNVRIGERLHFTASLRFRPALTEGSRVHVAERWRFRRNPRRSKLRKVDSVSYSTVKTCWVHFQERLGSVTRKFKFHFLEQIWSIILDFQPGILWYIEMVVFI